MKKLNKKQENTLRDSTGRKVSAVLSNPLVLNDSQLALLLGIRKRRLEQLRCGRGYLTTRETGRICALFGVEAGDITGSARKISREGIKTVPLSEVPSLKQGLEKLDELRQKRIQG